MTTYELCKNLRRLVLNESGQCMYYESLSSDYVKTSMNDIVKKIKNMNGFFLIDPHDLTLDEMKDLDFGRWSEETDLMLIPLWLFGFINPDIDVLSISNDVVKFKDADNDVRFGCLAYGVIPKK